MSGISTVDFFEEGRCSECSILASKSSSLIRTKSSPFILISSPLYSGTITKSPTSTDGGVNLPSELRRPLPTATTLASFVLVLAASGNIMPPGVLLTGITR